VIDDLVEDIDTKGFVIHWPWEYPEFSWDKRVLTQYEGIKRFHDLTCTKYIRRKQPRTSSRNISGFTYRSEFEENLRTTGRTTNKDIFKSVESWENWNREVGERCHES
jgi:hypothetical protein